MQSGPQKTVTLVLGGARSGKSRYAQELASAFQRVVYIATARRDDAEMRAKIARHRRERPRHGKPSRFPRASTRLCGSKAQARPAARRLPDPLYGQHHGPEEVRGAARFAITSNFSARRFERAEASVVMVSNEVGSGVVPPYRSGRDYRDFFGELNQQMAKVADRVILMVAGLPLTVKDRSKG